MHLTTRLEVLEWSYSAQQMTKPLKPLTSNILTSLHRIINGSDVGADAHCKSHGIAYYRLVERIHG